MAMGTADSCFTNSQTCPALLAPRQAQVNHLPGTADPLHNKEATARVILDIGGDYLIGTKEKTPNGWTSGAEPSPHHPRHRRAA